MSLIMEARHIRHLVERKSSSNTSSNHICPAQNINDPPQVSSVANLSFQQVIEIISGACLALSCLSTFFLIFRHASHYSVPQEQKQIIRVAFTIPVFAFVSFLCIYFQSAAIYITPIADLYEAFSFAAFFMLLNTFAQEAALAQSLSGEKSLSTPAKTSKTGPLIYQFPLMMFIASVATEITEATGTYCNTETKPYFAKLWITLLKTISTAVAAKSLIRFYRASKPLIGPRHALSKFVAFKGIVFLNFIQTILFNFLMPQISPTTTITTLDFTVGIPHLVLSLEMVIFSVVFIRVYSAGEYMNAKSKSGVLGAILEASNVFTFIGEMVREAMGKGGKSGRYESVPVAVTGDYQGQYQSQPQGKYKSQYESEYYESAYEVNDGHDGHDRHDDHSGHDGNNGNDGNDGNGGFDASF